MPQSNRNPDKQNQKGGRWKRKRKKKDFQTWKWEKRKKGWLRLRIETSLWPLEAAKWRGELRPPKVEYFARQGLHSRSIFASTKSPSLAADTNLSPEAEHPNEFPITHTHTKWDQIFTMEALKNKETKSNEREEANLNAMGCGVYLWCEEIWKLCFRIWWGRNCDGDVAPSSLYLSNFVRQRRIKQKEGLKVVARNVIEVGVNGGFVIWCGTKGKGEQWTQHKFMKENEGSHFLFMFCSLLLSESCFDFFVCSSLFDTLVKILPIFF